MGMSVDVERKEELMLAKQVRTSSVKILRMSPGPATDESAQEPKKDFSVASPNVVPPSPVVMRYWNQCTEGADGQKDKDSSAPSWKDDALEGEVTQFPSIRQKISQMEEEAKMVTKVPDVKRKLDLGELKPAGWMEARKKLQSQLDVLLTKTSAKMNVLSKKEEEKEKS